MNQATAHVPEFEEPDTRDEASHGAQTAHDPESRGDHGAADEAELRRTLPHDPADYSAAINEALQRMRSTRPMDRDRQREKERNRNRTSDQDNRDEQDHLAEPNSLPEQNLPGPAPSAAPAPAPARTPDATELDIAPLTNAIDALASRMDKADERSARAFTGITDALSALASRISGDNAATQDSPEEAPGQGTAVNAEFINAFRALTTQVQDLGARMTQLEQADKGDLESLAGLEDAVRRLTLQAEERDDEGAGGLGAIEAKLSQMEARIEELQGDHAAGTDSLRERIFELSETLDHVSSKAQSAVQPKALAALEQRMQEQTVRTVTEALDGALDGAVSGALTGALDGALNTALSGALDRALGKALDEFTQRLEGAEDRSAEAIQTLERDVTAIHDHLQALRDDGPQFSGGGSGNSNSASFDMLDDRLDQMERQNTRSLEDLRAEMRTLADRMIQGPRQGVVTDEDTAAERDTPPFREAHQGFDSQGQDENDHGQAMGLRADGPETRESAYSQTAFEDEDDDPSGPFDFLDAAREAAEAAARARAEEERNGQEQDYEQDRPLRQDEPGQKWFQGTREETAFLDEPPTFDEQAFRNESSETPGEDAYANRDRPLAGSSGRGRTHQNAADFSDDPEERSWTNRPVAIVLLTTACLGALAVGAMVLMRGLDQDGGPSAPGSGATPFWQDAALPSDTGSGPLAPVFDTLAATNTAGVGGLDGMGQSALSALEDPAPSSIGRIDPRAGALRQDAGASNPGTGNSGTTRLETSPALAGTPLLDSRNASLNGEALYAEAISLLNARQGSTSDQNAARMLDQAARSGLAAAHYHLGTLYQEGRGVAQDQARARSHFEVAALAGNRRAMHNLAVIFASGVGVPQDYTRAASWFERAARLGVTDSQFNLAVLYLRGEGVNRDPAQALHWFTIAAAQGDQEAVIHRDDLTRSLGQEGQAIRSQAANWTPEEMNKAANGLFQDKTADRNSQPGDIEMMQSLLAGIGYDIGAVDGTFGPRTREAVRQFQRTAGLPVTGEWSATLMDRLRAQARQGR